MRPSPFAALLCALFAFAPAPTAHGGEAGATYGFAPPVVAETADGFLLASVEACASDALPGQPILPARTARILLPPDAVVRSVSAELEAPVVRIALAAPLAFGRAPVPMSGPAAADPPEDAPDPAVYASDAPHPASRAQLVSVQRLHGCAIAIVRVFPAQYFPTESQLAFCPSIRVSVVYDQPVPVKAPAVAAAAAAEPFAPQRLERVRAFVDNPDALAAYAPAAVSPTARLAAADEPGATPEFDYLLVTRAALTNAFQRLVDHKVAAGLAVKVATMEDILATFPGVDDAAKLRACISDAYETWGVSYVLLGGDVSTVPYRGAYARTSGQTDTAMPCDLYFACLDGTWNADNDALWGEPTDGEDGGDVDLLAEVYVGRAPVDTPAEATAFVAKTIAYADNRHANVDDALLLGEYLGLYNGIVAQGGDGLDPLLPSLSRHYVSWLDDRPQARRTWNATAAVAALGAAPHLVGHYGHGNAVTGLGMGNADVARLVNPHPFLAYSSACQSGEFDKSDCFAEELIKRPVHGAFAAVMNSSLGWFSSLDESKYSGEFMASFFDQLLVSGDPSIGAAHQRAKHERIGSVETSGSYMTYRWCYFEITLFGDPHTMLQLGDDLQALPRTGVSAIGYEGAAFSPPEHVFAVTNRGAAALDWSVAYASDWLAATPSGGNLAPGAATNVVVALAPAVESLPEGFHADTLVFSNAVSGLVSERAFALTVLPPPGEIAVSDSMPPGTDGAAAFGPVIVGLCSNAFLCITNTHPENDLVVHGVALAGDPAPDAVGFALASPPAFPLTLPPGTGVIIDILYAPPAVGVHTAAVVVASNDKDEPATTIALSGRGIYDYLAVIPEQGLDASGHPGGPFTPAGGTWVVSNNSDRAVAWTAIHPAWLDAVPASGLLAPGAAATLSAAFNVAAAALPEGVYGGALILSNTTTSLVHPLPLSLDVFTTPSIGFAPTTLAITNRLGHVGTAPLRVANAVGADADLDFNTIALSSEPPAWLGVLPATGENIAPGSWADLVVSAEAGTRPAGTYEGVIVFASNDRDTPSANVPATMIVLPDDLGILEAAGLASEGFAGGPFAPGGSVYTLTNAGPAALSWTAAADAAWLAVSPTSGTLAPGASVAVAVDVAAAAQALSHGAYEATLAVSNATSGAVQFRFAALTVKERLLDHFEWDALAPLQHVAEPFAATVRAIDNAGDPFPAFAGTVSLYATNGVVSALEPYEGTNAWRHPLCTYYHDARTQVIYLKEELDGPALITGLSLAVVATPGPMNAWTIRLKHTTRDGYSSASRNWETNGWTVVLQTNAVVNALGWATFPFSAPFVYNGEDNLLVDFSFNNASYTRDGYCLVTGVPASRSLYYHTDSGYGDPLKWNGTWPSGSIATNIPNIRLDRRGVVPLSPTTTSAFTGGVWSGELTAGEEARGVRIFANDGAGHLGRSGSFDVVYRVVSLEEALDNPSIVWTSGGASNWWGQTVVAQDGVDAARSGKAGHRQSSWLEAQAIGPGSALFWWRVSSEADWDWLEFYLDGALADRISGETEWLPKTLSLGPGLHTLRWRYVKDAADLDPIGRDCGWVDWVVGPSSSSLPLLWLVENGLATDGSADEADADGDRLLNWQEWVAGTMPTNAASALRMQEATPLPADGGTRVRWQSVAGRRYWVESAESLGAPAAFTPFASNIVGQAGATEILDTRPAPVGARFYRVGVHPE